MCIRDSKTLLDHITPSSVFAETYACVPGTPMMVSAVADEPSEVLFLPSETLLSLSLIHIYMSAICARLSKGKG